MLLQFSLVLRVGCPGDVLKMFTFTYCCSRNKLLIFCSDYVSCEELLYFRENFSLVVGITKSVNAFCVNVNDVKGTPVLSFFFLFTDSLTYESIAVQSRFFFI